MVQGEDSTATLEHIFNLSAKSNLDDPIPSNYQLPPSILLNSTLITDDISLSSLFYHPTDSYISDPIELDFEDDKPLAELLKKPQVTSIHISQISNHSRSFHINPKLKITKSMERYYRYDMEKSEDSGQSDDEPKSENLPPPVKKFKPLPAVTKKRKEEDEVITPQKKTKAVVTPSNKRKPTSDSPPKIPDQTSVLFSRFRAANELVNSKKNQLEKITKELEEAKQELQEAQTALLSTLMTIPNVMEILQKGLQLEDLELQLEPETKKIKNTEKNIEKNVSSAGGKISDKSNEKVPPKVEKKMGGQKVQLETQLETIRFVGEEQITQNIHKKKIKCVSLNPKHHNLLASMSLDGYIKLWDIKILGKKVDVDINSSVFSIPARVPEVKCGNSVQWNRGGDRLAVTLPYEEKSTQVILLTDISQNFGKLGVHLLNSRPHKKDVLASCFYNDSRLFTVSADHKVFCWNLNDENVTEFEEKHTSSVTSASCPGNDYLFTGGADKRFLEYSCMTGKVLRSRMLPNRIINVKENPVDSNLIMIYQAARDKQIALMDTRVWRLSHYLSFTTEVNAELSANVMANWSLDGRYISCGHTQPVVNIWDIRYLRNTCHEEVLECSHPPTQPSLSIGTEERVYQGILHPKNFLISITSKREMIFNSFEIIKQ